MPEGATIPGHFIENPNRIGSYGVIDTNGKFQEMLRIDTGTPPEQKGANNSHFHLNGGRRHIFNIKEWPWWR